MEKNDIKDALEFAKKVRKQGENFIDTKFPHISPLLRLDMLIVWIEGYQKGAEVVHSEYKEHIKLLQRDLNKHDNE